MPLVGSLDVSGRVADAPLADDLATEPLTLEGAEVFQAMFEIESGPMTDVLPPALHPTIPPTVTFNWLRGANDDIGSFIVCSVRLGSRAGVRPRGFVIGARVTGDDAALRSKWGYPTSPADVRLERRHHEVVASVVDDGRTILAVTMQDPEPISGTDVQWAASMHLARVVREGAEVPRLVQVDPEVSIRKADRGVPRLDAFDADAWGDARIVLTQPVMAWYLTGDVTMPRIRYLCDPAVAALQGTEKIA